MRGIILSDIKVDSIWKHSGKKATGDLYQVYSVSQLKLGGTWLEEPLISYRSAAGEEYSRLESEFKKSFTLTLLTVN